MGGNAAAPIDEAVFLLSKLAPTELEGARQRFPSLQNELVVGKEGGVSSDELDLERAQVMIKALDVARKSAESELISVRSRMTSSRKHRLISQIVTLVGSSGVLATLTLENTTVSVITATLTLLASIGTLIAENEERLVQQGEGNIYDAYERAGQAAYKAGALSAELGLLVKHRASRDEINVAVGSANALCEELNGWITKIAGGRSK